MVPILALLPSPLVGPAVWQPASMELRRRGWTTSIAPSKPAEARTPDDVLQSILDALPTDQEAVLVAHSNAGLYLPALVQRRSVVAAVFVDAALPPKAGGFPLAPEALYQLLVEMADENGLLPPWTRWWDSNSTEGLFPTAAARRRVEAQQRRLPLSYFAATMNAPAGWDEVPTAYLAFGDTYADEQERAARWGWPTTRLPGRHLHMLVDPSTVAGEVHALLTSLGISPNRSAATAARANDR